MGPGVDVWLFTGYGGSNSGKHKETCSPAQADFRRGSVTIPDLFIHFHLLMHINFPISCSRQCPMGRLYSLTLLHMTGISV